MYATLHSFWNERTKTTSPDPRRAFNIVETADSDAAGNGVETSGTAQAAGVEISRIRPSRPQPERRSGEWGIGNCAKCVAARALVPSRRTEALTPGVVLARSTPTLHSIFDRDYRPVEKKKLCLPRRCASCPVTMVPRPHPTVESARNFGAPHRPRTRAIRKVPESGIDRVHTDLSGIAETLRIELVHTVLLCGP